jgi:hypothetical protein
MVIAHYIGPEPWVATLIKKEPFTPEEVQAILKRIDGQPQLGAVYVPDVFEADEQERVEAKAFLFDPEGLKPARKAYYGLIRTKSLSERNLFEKNYLYNITPTYDDRPFFFEYHKIAEIFRSDMVNKEPWLRGTIVHYVLFFLLGLTGFVAFLAMIVPLYIFEHEGLKIQRVWSLLGFFSSLGIGFMFLELGIIQKLSLYLGHPMYTLAVVLTGILLFTGIGSYYTGTRNINKSTLLKQGMLGTALLALVWMLAMKFIIPATLGSHLLIRIMVSLVSIFPVAICMGIPFATGLYYLEQTYPRFIPWAWGINGLTSVMGSVLSIIIAMRIGFSVVIIFGCLTYIIGLCSILYHFKSNSLIKS